MQGKLEEAAAKYQEAITIKPKDPSPLIGYALTLREQGKLEEAASKFQEALAI